MLTTLSERNNNPFSLLQIKPSSWRGLVGKEANGFLKFDSLLNGLRAGYVNIIQKVNSGVNTIDKIFANYGDPGHEETYKKMVEKVSGIGRYTPINSSNQLIAIAKGIVKMESGKEWVNDTDLKTGLSEALKSYPLKQ